MKQSVRERCKISFVRVTFFSFTGTGPVSSGICAFSRHQRGLNAI